MRYTLIASFAAAALVIGAAAHAQNHSTMDHQRHMAAMMGDNRQLVEFPPEMRQHTLASMRDHLAAIAEILAAISKADYAQAARVADARLGMASPSAEGCKADGASEKPQMSQPLNMDAQMSQLMPEGMRRIGLAMHQSASVFAAEAAKASKTGDATPALVALSRVTEQCTACHSAYKVQ